MTDTHHSPPPARRLTELPLVGLLVGTTSSRVFSTATLVVPSPVAGYAVQQVEGFRDGCVTGSLVESYWWERFLKTGDAIMLDEPTASPWNEVEVWRISLEVQLLAAPHEEPERVPSQLLARHHDVDCWLVEVGNAAKALRRRWSRAFLTGARDRSFHAKLREKLAFDAFALTPTHDAEVWGVLVHILRLQGRIVGADGMLTSAGTSIGADFGAEVARVEQEERMREGA
jgi:hypothetical protein